MFVLELGITILALPEDESRRHQHHVAELLVDVLEVLEEVQCLIVGAAEPNIVFDSIVWPLDIELGHQEQ